MSLSIVRCVDLYLVNTASKQHNRVVYSSQAIHHVAHQVASLYWSAVSQEARSQATFARGVEKSVDLSKHMYGPCLGRFSCEDVLTSSF